MPMMHMTKFKKRAATASTRFRRTAAEDLRQAAGRPAEQPTALADAAVRPARRGSPNAAKRLPELAPADAPSVPTKTLVGIDMRSEAVVEEETRFSKREETHSETARLTVYTLNATLLIMAFPVGFGMLVFNILGGENLRTTAHVMALTGMGIALATATGGVPFLGAA